MTMSKGSYAQVNGLNMYYEIHGEGLPLVLLHGALSAIGTSFGKLLPDLARERQVIAVEMQGHGHTADIDRPLRYEQLADDIAALLTQIGIEKADLFGWSLGAGVALQTAIRHLQPWRTLSSTPGGNRKLETRGSGRNPILRGIHQDRTESAGFSSALRQAAATGRRDPGLAGRGHSCHQGAHLAHHRGFGHHPSRAHGRVVSPAWRR